MLGNLDSKDRAIIDELDRNSRIAASNISKIIKIPKETVNYRIKRLEEKGYINKFYTIINASLFGYHSFKVFLKLQNNTNSVDEQLEKYVMNNKTCYNFRFIQGYYDVVFVTMHKTPIHLQRFIEGLMDIFGEYVIEKTFYLVIREHKINMKNSKTNKLEKITFNLHKQKKREMDKTDITILKHIAGNSKIKALELSEITGESPRVMIYRLKKLEEEGIIAGYSISLDFELLGFELVQIDMSLKTFTVIKSIIEFFGKTGMCIFAYEMMGEYDLCIELVIKNDEELRKILGKFKERFMKHYTKYDVSHVYKEDIINLAPFSIPPETDNEKQISGNMK